MKSHFLMFSWIYYINFVSLEYAKKMLPMIEIKVLVVQDQHVRYLAFGIFLSTARAKL